MKNTVLGCAAVSVICAYVRDNMKPDGDAYFNHVAKLEDLILAAMEAGFEIGKEQATRDVEAALFELKANTLGGISTWVERRDALLGGVEKADDGS